ncbi:ribosomal-protein-alanine acetyltransferase RimJ [Janthinobacterium sp. HH01]|uniref:GNAT family N-acetyltransferase n=1 Tax=Janthinobacterium sp. HH01 TaxID=1198452 RepID=UPI0002AEC471|nr:GNAT family N-acetyltransferase [Janthinobacterium sp. HH01]ELX10148.1 ribosomal-protein-alanine acetyltransferase RimJ [Janthinobacterium sp. HH01]
MSSSSRQLVTDRLLLTRPAAGDSAGLLAYREANRAHLEPWEPLRTDQFYTLQAVEERLRQMARQVEENSAVYWLLRFPHSAEVVGECSFTNIVRGPFQACHLGFSLDSRHTGQGLMHEALVAAIADLFDIHRLHRIMANYQPGNKKSGELLRRLGFEREGLARKYLKIGGGWADHVLTSFINPRDG